MRGGGVQSVDKAFILLDILAEAGSPMRLLDLSKRTGWPQSTIYGLLSAMRGHSAVEQRPDGRYCLGIRLFEYGSMVSSGWDISEIARPYLQDLAAKTGSSALLSVLYHDKALTIGQIENHSGLHVVSDIGTRLPLYCTSQGKVFLAAMAPPAAAKVLAGEPLVSYTPHTLVRPEEIERELSAVRRQGYAVENGEYRIGLRSVSAPVYDLSGRVRYAVGIVGIFRRIESPEFIEAVRASREAAGRLSSALCLQEEAQGQPP